MHTVWAILMGMYAFSDPDKMKTDTSFGCCVNTDSHLEPFYCTEKNQLDESTSNVTNLFEIWFTCMFVASLFLALMWFVFIVFLCISSPMFAHAPKISSPFGCVTLVLIIMGAVFRWSDRGVMCSGDFLENSDTKD